MGQITSILSTLGSVNSTIGSITKTAGNINKLSGNSDVLKQLRAQQDQVNSQLAAKQALEEQLAQRKMMQDSAMIKAEADQAERRRLAALKSETAKQRAALGASGVAPDTGSGEAVLLGLFQQSDAERSDREAVDSIRQKILDENYAAVKSRNLLEAAQLNERQALQRRLL